MIEEQQFLGAVAVLDVLGFRHRMRNLGTKELTDKVIGVVVDSTRQAQLLTQHDIDRFPGTSQLEWMYFADTVVLFLPMSPGSILGEPQQVVASMVYACCLLVARAMWLDIPLRGAISFGEGIVCRDPLFFVGRPFLDATSLERSQLWAGVALADSASAQVNEESDPRLIRWPVPIRSGEQKVEVDYLVVNWPCSSMGPHIRQFNSVGNASDGPMPDFDSCFDSNDEDVLEKRANTERFFHNERAKRVGGPKFGPEQRELNYDWREVYRERR